MGEVGRIVDEGTPMEVADRAFAGFAPMPPFVLLGLVGPPIALHNNESLHAAFPQRFHVPDGLRRLVAAGKPGFYVYPEGRPVPDPEVMALMETPANPVVLDSGQVREQVLSALAEEAQLMLDEGVVAAPMDLDLAMITGAGFAFWNGGLTPLLDRTGLSEKVNGKRFLPPGVASVPA
jgi:3-hydroxyacyl-CoA dehydrogenase